MSDEKTSFQPAQKQTGNLEPTLNADKSASRLEVGISRGMDQLENPTITAASLEVYNLKCNECGLLCDDELSAEAHAAQTDHSSFIEISQDKVAEATHETERDTGDETLATERVLRMKLRGEHPETLGSLSDVAHVLREQAEYETGEETYRRNWIESKNILGEEHPETLRSIYDLASVLHEQGKNKESELFYRQALRGRERTLGDEHPDTLSSLSSLALLLIDIDNFAEAEENHCRALRGLEKIHGKEHPNTLASVHNLAAVLRARNKSSEAELCYRRAVKGREMTLGYQHPDTLASLSNLASLLKTQEKYIEAEQIHRRVLEGYQNTAGKDHPETIRSAYSLAKALHESEKYGEAEQLRQQALEGRRKILGDMQLISLTQLGELGNKFRQQGKYRAAEEIHRRVSEGLGDILGKDHLDTLRGIGDLANALVGQRKCIEAEKTYRRALDGFKKILGEGSHETITIANNLGTVYLEQGKYYSAEKTLRQAMEGYAKIYGREHPYTLRAINNIIIALQGQGKYPMAKKMLEEELGRVEELLRMGHRETLIGMELCELQKEWSQGLRIFKRVTESSLTISEALETPDSKPWLGAPITQGYMDISDEVDISQLEIQNADEEFGGIRDIFNPSPPLALEAKESGKATTVHMGNKDFVVSDVDEQLMLFVPFRRTVKVHSIHVTSLIPTNDNGETRKRPKTINLVINHPHILGFEETAQFTQQIQLRERDWSQETGTAIIYTRYVNFQNVSTLGIFVVDGLEQVSDNDGVQGETTRLDRIRVIGKYR